MRSFIVGNKQCSYSIRTCTQRYKVCREIVYSVIGTKRRNNVCLIILQCWTISKYSIIQTSLPSWYRRFSGGRCPIINITNTTATACPTSTQHIGNVVILNTSAGIRVAIINTSAFRQLRIIVCPSCFIEDISISIKSKSSAANRQHIRTTCRIIGVFHTSGSPS